MDSNFHSKLIAPATNFKLSGIRDHRDKNVGHRSAIPCELERHNSSLALQHREATECRDVVTYNAFQCCYWLAKEEVANRKLLSLIDLQKRGGAAEMKYFKQTSERSQKEMRLLIGQLIKSQLLNQVYTAKWFSILVDEVTDCSTIEQLLVYVGYVDVKGESHFQYLDCIDVLAESHSPDAATITRCILDELEASSLNTNHSCGFGSDGASVMTGDINGVGARLQRITKSMLRTHCISHRLALACGDAKDSVKYIQVVETILRQLWKWLEYPKRSSAFVKACENLHKIDLVNNPGQQKRLSTKIQKACRTRWLSTGQSISSVCKNFVALMQTLRLFKEKDATAHGLLSRMNNAKFVGTILLLNAILSHLNSLSKLFQKDHTCYASIQPVLECTKSALKAVRESLDIVAELEQKIRPGGVYAELELHLSERDQSRDVLVGLQKSYTNALEKNLDRRFTEAPVLKAFGIFDPTLIPSKTDETFAEYGRADVVLLSLQFNFNADETMAEWQNFKYQMCEFQIPDHVLKGKDISPTHYVLKKVIREQSSYRIGFNNIVELAQICLTQPLSNAVVERGASAVKRVKTRLRGSMKNEMLSSLLHVTINGPQQKSEDASNLLTEATSIWRKTHVRNLPTLKRLPNVGGSDHVGTSPVHPTTTDSGMQTDSQAQAMVTVRVQIDTKDEEAADNALREFEMAICGSECHDSGLESECDSDI